MAVAAGDAFLDIHAQLASNFGRQLASQVQAPVTRAGEQASHHFARSMGHGLATTGKLIGAGIAGGLGLAVVAAVKLTPVLKQSVQGYRDHLKVVAQTTAAIKSTGGAANVSVKGVGRLADALERKTTIDGDVIQSGQNMLLTFKNVRNETGRGNDIFNQASSTVLDMAAAFGHGTVTSAGMQQASIQLGKALGDPIAGIGALSRVGVTFTKQQKDQIKTLVESGNTLGAQKIILKELNSEFGGSAAAQATASGRMQVAWHQLQDTIGSVLLPVVDRFENSLGKKLIPDIDVLATRWGPAVQTTLLRWVDGFTKLLPSTKELGYGITALGAAFSDEGITTSADSFVGKMERLGVTGRAVVDWAKQFGPHLAAIGASFSKLFQGASQAGPALQQAGGGGHVFANSLIVIGPILDVVARNIHNIIPWLPAILAGFLAFRAIRSVAQPFVQLGEVISNLTAPFRIVALYGQRRALQAHTTALVENTAALRGNAVSEELATAATNTGAVASIRMRVATIAQAIAQRAVALASKVWAGAQWLVNAALTANPIGIVIVSVAALAAGIIYAYKHSETFRKIVQGAFNGVKTVIGLVVTSIIASFRAWFNIATTVVGGIIHVFGKLPGPLGAPFRKAEDAVRNAKKTVNEQLDKIQARVNRLTGKTINIKARTDVEITKSVRQYLAASNVPGFHAKGYRIPGYGGGDIYPAMLEPGETVVSKESSKLPWMQEAFMAAGVPGYQMGGLVTRFRTPTIAETRRIGISEGKVAAAAMRQLMANLGAAGSAAMFAGFKGTIQQMARAMLAARGWGGQWASFNALEMGEAGWNIHARNPSSGAYGLPQALPPSKLPAAAFSSNLKVAAAAQLGWMMDYIAGRYRNPANAYRTWLSRSPHWYDQGGFLPTGTSVAVNTTGRPEPVGIDYARLGRAVADALREMPPQVVLDGRRVDQALAGARISNAGRR